MERYALAYTKPGTTLTFWLNHFWTGGHIWSPVRSVEDFSDQRWYQPPLRFNTAQDASDFIAAELGDNPDVRLVLVTD